MRGGGESVGGFGGKSGWRCGGDGPVGLSMLNSTLQCTLKYGSMAYQPQQLPVSTPHGHFSCSGHFRQPRFISAPPFSITEYVFSSFSTNVQTLLKHLSVLTYYWSSSRSSNFRCIVTPEMIVQTVAMKLT